MRRFLLGVLACVAVGYAALLAGGFLYYALPAMEEASGADPRAIARFGSPMGNIGLGVGAVIASLGVLLVGVRCLITPRMSEVWPPKEPQQ